MRATKQCIICALKEPRISPAHRRDSPAAGRDGSCPRAADGVSAQTSSIRLGSKAALSATTAQADAAAILASVAEESYGECIVFLNFYGAFFVRVKIDNALETDRE